MIGYGIERTKGIFLVHRAPVCSPYWIPEGKNKEDDLQSLYTMTSVPASPLDRDQAQISRDDLVGAASGNLSVFAGDGDKNGPLGKVVAMVVLVRGIGDKRTLETRLTG